MTRLDIGKRILLDSIEGAGYGCEIVTIEVTDDIITIKPYVAPDDIEERLKLAHEALLDEATLARYQPDGPAIPDTDLIRRGAIGTGYGIAFMRGIVKKWLNVDDAEAEGLVIKLMERKLVIWARDVNGGCGSWTEYGAVAIKTDN